MIYIRWTMTAGCEGGKCANFHTMAAVMLPWLQWCFHGSRELRICVKVRADGTTYIPSECLTSCSTSVHYVYSSLSHCYCTSVHPLPPLPSPVPPKCIPVLYICMCVYNLLSKTMLNCVRSKWYHNAVSVMACDKCLTAILSLPCVWYIP